MNRLAIRLQCYYKYIYHENLLTLITLLLVLVIYLRRRTGEHAVHSVEILSPKCQRRM